ncbi:hypothetical protein GQ53DRAFT_402675 [Thozetella sp. PMI_491]|nr:hypothetical protein GQ53DRAFT_402675 [Thozetella sp. PMI_491]
MSSPLRSCRKYSPIPGRSTPTFSLPLGGTPRYSNPSPYVAEGLGSLSHLSPSEDQSSLPPFQQVHADLPPLPRATESSEDSPPSYRLAIMSADDVNDGNWSEHIANFGCSCPEIEYRIKCGAKSC